MVRPRQWRENEANKAQELVNYKPAIVTAYYKSQGLPAPVYEYRHIPDRKFRLDLAWIEQRAGVEVQGGLWIKAAHSTGKGIKRDMEKRNLGVINGWKILECEPKDLCTLDFVNMLRKIL